MIDKLNFLIALGVTAAGHAISFAELDQRDAVSVPSPQNPDC
jgi:hypothetical protein